MNKYLWKNRIILIETPDSKNKQTINARKIYEDNLQEFHKRFFILKIYNNINLKFKIKLIGFDGKVKYSSDSLDHKIIFEKVDKMPMGHLRQKYKKLNPKNLSLYADYNKKTTLKGLGFKNKEKAIYTLKKIKSKPIKYQISVVNTMIGRAINHPHYNSEMKAAVKIFKKWLKSIK